MSRFIRIFLGYVKITSVIIVNDFMIRYTEDRYCTRKEVSEDLCVSLIDPIWNEIEQYRDFFRFKIPGIKKLCFCLCAGILKKILVVQTLLNKQSHGLSMIDFIDGLLDEKNDEKVNWLILRWNNTRQSSCERLKELTLLFPDIKKNVVYDFLLDEHLPVFCRWILIFMLVENSRHAILLFLALCSEDVLPAAAIAKRRLLHLSYEEDGTYALQTMLDEIIGELLRNDDRVDSRFKYDALVYQYPQLKEYQIRFYVNHHTVGHYYTLNQFSKWCHVCYETSRCAMEQLVQLNFYTRLKIGKKFVYTPKG